ncbi:MAG: LamG domain-containing protein [Kiritimatiellae bacterium]|nr:LamG domain-containing protein [Kiritimatiellia bacterium]MDW8458876.1 LamG domain-containing protein [Verrucomicrobiota bacterium]
MKLASVFLSFLACAATARADLTDGLLAAYFFDGNAEDASGRGHDAQLIGATFTVDRHGNPNGALWLDGQGAYAATPVSGKRFPIAFSFWLRLDARRGERAFSVVDSGIGNAFGHSFVIGNNARTFNANLAVPARFRSGEWAHVVVSYGPKLQVFVNGELAGERDYSEDDSYIAGNFQLGRHLDSEDPRFFHGAIDDVLIYARTLQADEVRALYAEGPRVAADIRAAAELRRRVLAALAARSVASEGMESSADDPRPIFVAASSGAEPHTNVWHVVDRDPDSLWSGAAGEPAWWIAAEFHPSLALKNLVVETPDGIATNTRIFISETADEWPEFDPVDAKFDPPTARFILVTFPPDEGGQPPTVTEIRWNAEE